MYPQYAGATTGSSLEKLFDVVKTMRVVPSVRVVPPYYEDPAWLDAVAAVTTRTLESLPFKPDRVLFSFHGLPKRYAALGDPYPRQCEASARLLAGRMHLAAEQTLLVFQSRFGREEWLQPYADVTIGALGREGLKIAVVTPGFTADCLETIEEIGLRGAEQFHESGGKDYARVPCVNTDDTWLAGMATIARRELSGWL
jgi:ferrochelatase